MAGLGRLRSGSGVKRKLSEVTGAVYDDDRAAKRISPFYNTPIQKKETKRRILRISMRKMRQIACPEMFLRRSVLINNLARSLQDDLKDDRLWGRWDWAGDLEMDSPYRSASPVTPRDAQMHRDNTCTLLTNTCSSMTPMTDSGNSEWTLDPQAHWLSSGDDVHMSESEHERLARDFNHTHDSIAATVESLTAFDTDFGGTVKDCSPDLDSDIDDPFTLTEMKNVTSVSTSPGQSHVTHYTSCCCIPTTTASSDSCLLKRDINKNQIYPCISCRNKPLSVTSTDQHYQTSYISNNSSGTAKFSDNNRYSDIFMDKYDCFDKLLENDPWTVPCPSLDYIEDAGSTYLDITSNNVTSSSNSSSLLDSLDSCIPCLQTSVALPTPVAVDLRDDLCALTIEDPSAQSKCNFTSANTSSSADVTASTGLWNTPVSYNMDMSSPTPGTSTTASCSAEAERSEVMTTQQSTSPEGFSTLREFDVIYNNLVSVLIGGN